MVDWRDESGLSIGRQSYFAGESRVGWIARLTPRPTFAAVAPDETMLLVAFIFAYRYPRIFFLIRRISASMKLHLALLRVKS